MEPLTQLGAMSFEEVMAEFAVVGRLPKEAIEYSLSNWSEFGPQFVQLIEEYVSGTNRSKELQFAFILMLGVLAESKEKASYRPLCRFLLNKEFACDCLDDFITGGLSGVLINVCDGDPGPLQQVVECTQAEEFARSAALEALAYLSINGDLPSLEMHAYLNYLYNKLQPEADCYIWTTWVSMVAHLEYGDLVPMAEKALKSLMPEFSMNEKDLRFFLNQSRGTLDKRIVLERDHIRPFGNTVEHFSWWHCYTPEYLKPAKKPALEKKTAKKSVSSSYFLPVENRGPKVGRNDPCPCGSGKKFKKCCCKGSLP